MVRTVHKSFYYSIEGGARIVCLPVVTHSQLAVARQHALTR